MWKDDNWEWKCRRELGWGEMCFKSGSQRVELHALAARSRVVVAQRVAFVMALRPVHDTRESFDGDALKSCKSESISCFSRSKETVVGPSPRNGF